MPLEKKDKAFPKPYTREETFSVRLTAIMLKKSSSPSVSSMEATVCLAIVNLKPFILPLTSTRITTSLGEVAAWIYLGQQASDRNIDA